MLAISGNNASRVFNVNPVTTGETVDITGLTIRNGFVIGDGGGIINNDAQLFISDPP